MRTPDATSEARLDRLRAEALPAALLRAAPDAMRGYGGRPVLKPPVWTWEVPLYFFLGGAAGAASVIAAAALVSGELALARAGLWLAAACGAVCPVLLTLDLGRRWRAPYMFRVFKLRSPMSVGSWTLLLFGLSSAAAALAYELELAWALVPASFTAALAGLGMATYTGVLLGASAIPVWYEHRRLLPVHMGAGALGSAAAALALLVPGAPVPARLLVLAAAAECACGALLELDRRAASRPLHQGASGRKMRAGGVLAGPVALLLALASAPAAAAAAFLAGALLLRYGWIAAGRASAADPAPVLAPGTNHQEAI
jgi:hypothetical protein